MERRLFLEVSGEFVEVVRGEDVHKYLGRKLRGNMKARGFTELSHRIQLAWMRFHKHRDILLGNNLNIRSRLKFFQSVVGATLLYGLPTCALTAKQLESLDVLQRKMLRNMVGWTRREPEDWSDTMRRMRDRVEAALRQYPIENWSAQLLRRQFRMVCRFSAQNDEWPMRISRWHPTVTENGAHRSPGRPPVRWDDRLNLFAHTCLHQGSWLEACAFLNFPKHEDAYVQFFSSGA